MKRKAAIIIVLIVLAVVISSVLIIAFRREPIREGVRNVDTGLSYSTIQGAIDAPETRDGHTIVVALGIYYEHVFLNKTLSLLGEDRDNTIVDGGGEGIVVYINATRNVVFSNFTVRNGAYGIRLYHSDNSTVDGNNVYDCKWFGLELKYSGNNTLRSNSLDGNRYNFGVDGGSPSDFLNDIDTSNTVNGKPIYYLINQRDLVIDSSTFAELGYLALVNSSNVEVKDLDLRLNVEGVLFASVTDSVIRNVSVADNFNGIYVKFSSNVTVTENNANNNYDYAIALRSSENSTVRKNNVNDNNWGGISLGSTFNSSVIGNNVNNNYYGIHLVESDNNTVRKNGVSNKNGGYSVVLFRSNSNVIDHNNFVNSFIFAYIKSISTWDDGLEGNYWSGYTGIDANGDGVGNVPYALDENNRDNYPLMGRFSEFNVTWENEDYSVTIVSNSTISQFQFNRTEKKIGFNVTGEGGTKGFSRIAVPNVLAQDLWDGNFTVSVFGQQETVVRRNWTDGTYMYLYFAYTYSAPQWVVIPEFWIALILSFFIVFVVVFLKRKKFLRGLTRNASKVMFKKTTYQRVHTSHKRLN